MSSMRITVAPCKSICERTVICPLKRRARWAVPFICTDLPDTPLLSKASQTLTCRPVLPLSDTANRLATGIIWRLPRLRIDANEEGAGTISTLPRS